MLQTPRSDLLRRVLGSLRDHPHDNTVDQVARLLSLPADDVWVALRSLEEEGLAREARTHWCLSYPGWSAARADDPYGDAD
jgi:DNA-binding IclR family transcriptional regulator